MPILGSSTQLIATKRSASSCSLAEFDCILVVEPENTESTPDTTALFGTAMLGLPRVTKRPSGCLFFLQTAVRSPRWRSCLGTMESPRKGCMYLVCMSAAQSRSDLLHLIRLGTSLKTLRQCSTSIGLRGTGPGLFLLSFDLGAAANASAVQRPTASCR